MSIILGIREAKKKLQWEFLKIREEFGSFDRYIWQFVNYKTINSSFKSASQILARTIESDKMSKDLQKRGFIAKDTSF